MDIGFYVKKYLSAIVVTGRNHTMRKFVYTRLKNNSKELVLNTSQKKEINNYFSDYEKVTWKFHNFYTEKTGNYYVNYIPEDIYFNKINRYYNDYQLAKVMDHKCYYENLFGDFKQPVKLADRKSEYWFIGNHMSSFEQLLDMLCEEPAVFIKAAVDSSGGYGVKYVDKKECEDYRQSIKQTIEQIRVDITIQKPIIQHKDLSRLNDSSVNTIRILTVLRNGKVKIYSSILRIGNGNVKVDNHSSGGMSVGIDENGRLKKYAYLFNSDKVTQHPFSGVEFQGYQLPAFDNAQEMVKKAHLCVPHFKMISWDVAIDEYGEPVLIEANFTDGEIDFHQLNNGPLFGEDTKEILNEVYGK